MTIEFARQLETISTFLAAKGHRHALADALVLAAYGLPRTRAKEGKRDDDLAG